MKQVEKKQHGGYWPGADRKSKYGADEDDDMSYV
jgi:hypothetical protein